MFIDANVLHTLQMSENPPIVFDCRFSLADFSLGQQQYAQGHVSGAFLLDMENDLSGAKGEHGGRHPLPDIAAFQSKLRECGVTRDSVVVCYDQSSLAGSARLWWLLRYFGFNNIRILDGGYSTWVEAGFEISQQTPESGLGNIQLVAGSEPLVDRQQVLKILGEQGMTIIDCREEFRYRGESEPIDPVAGRMPGAVNYPWQAVTDDAGKIRESNFLEDYWGGLDQKKQWIMYCGSGVTAAVNMLAMVHSGLPMPVLYNNSWSDWCSYPDSPIEKDPSL